MRPSEFPLGPTAFGPGGDTLMGLAIRVNYLGKFSARCSLVEFHWQPAGLKNEILRRMMRGDLTDDERLPYRLSNSPGSRGPVSPGPRGPSSPRLTVTRRPTLDRSRRVKPVGRSARSETPTRSRRAFPVITWLPRFPGENLIKAP